VIIAILSARNRVVVWLGGHYCALTPSKFVSGRQKQQQQ